MQLFSLILPVNRCFYWLFLVLGYTQPLFKYFLSANVMIGETTESIL